MLSWAFSFIILAIVAALLGFTGLVGTAAGFAKFLFGCFLIVGLAMLALSLSEPKDESKKMV